MKILRLFIAGLIESSYLNFENFTNILTFIKHKFKLKICVSLNIASLPKNIQTREDLCSSVALICPQSFDTTILVVRTSERESIVPVVPI